MQSEEPIPIPKAAKTTGKKIRKTLLWFTAILFLLLAIPVLLIQVYQKEIKAQVVNELNKHLKVKVFINPDDIDFTILRTFPQAAIWFKNVTIMGSLTDFPKDTLLQAQSIYLLFNAKDIWNKNYIIKQVNIKNASLGILINDIGETNDEIWKESESISINKDKKESTAFKLNKIVLEGIAFRYKNYQSKLKIASTFKEITFSGNFSDVAYELDLKAQGFISAIRSNKKTYLKDKTISVNLSAAVSQNTYNLNKAEVTLNKLLFSVQGSLTNADTVMPCNISCKGKNIDIQSVLSLLPEKFHDKIKDYESDGVFYAEADLEGNLLDYTALAISSSFGITKASVTYLPLKTKLTDVNFTGSFNKKKYKPELLTLKNISARQNQNYVSGNLEFKNFSSPHLSFDAKGIYNLQDLLALVPIDTLASAKGMMDFSVQAALSLNEIATKKNGAGSLNGQLKLSNVELLFKNGKVIQVPEGLIKMENEDLYTENLKIMHQTSSLQISGKATNLLNYLFKEDQKIYINAEITSPFIHLDDFVFKKAETNTAKTPGTNPKLISINKNISADIKLNIDKVDFNSFLAKNLVGTLELKNKKILARNFSFAAFNGDITLNGLVDMSDSSAMKINCATGLVDVDMRKMFSQLNNFGQTVIEDKNLQGKATAQIDFSATWNNRLQCNLSSILAGADIVIDKGELIGLSSLESLSKYIELNELKRIKFSTLKTHVDIKNQLISFSKTELGNSALNLDVWGTHSFNNEIDYHIKLLLSDYLAKRPGKNKQLDEELLENENDPELKRSLFIHMTGTIDKPIIKYDRKAMKQKIKQDLKDEKKNLKRILNEEFGLFKKDTTLSKKENTKKQDQNFKIDFNQNTKKDKSDGKQKPKEEEDDF